MQMHPALRLALKAVGNTSLVYGMDRVMPSYFSVFGGVPAYITIGSLLTLLNLSLRPLLAIVTFPAKLLFTLFTVIAVNGFFLWVVYEISLKMDADLVMLVVSGGIGGWLVVSIVLGLGNWIMKHVLG